MSPGKRERLYKCPRCKTHLLSYHPEKGDLPEDVIVRRVKWFSMVTGKGVCGGTFKGTRRLCKTPFVFNMLRVRELVAGLLAPA